jgi:predicted Rossmann fold nucleotide-binding protein DprA/Smf involved in DNA uptake
MKVVAVRQGDASYPAALQQELRDGTPPVVFSLGNLNILQRETLALFCSVKCPGDLILKTYDLARGLRDEGTPVIGGFHSPMEKECLAILLRGTQPVIICPARSIEGMRLPGEWRTPLDDGRLLVLSQFEKKHRRVTAELARPRNRFVAALADRVFIAHAEVGSKTEAFAREVLTWGKPVLTLDSADNAALASLGATVLPSHHG